MAPRRAAKYRRISDDREGDELGIGRQDEDLDEFAERENLVYVASYVDNDKSASTRSKKRRDDYERMLADAKAGKFEVIAAYTTGRLTRRPREHEDLIDLAVDYGIEFKYIRSPSFDLKTSAGRRIARTLAAQDAGEAEDISERVERDVKRRAEAGEFHGGNLPFGVDADQDIVKGKVKYVNFRHHTTDAPRAKDAVRRVLAGETLYGIARDLGIQRRTLKRALTNPAIAGLREYNGEQYPTPWKPIVEADDWRRVVEILGDPERGKKEFNQRKYMLSGLVVCECDVVMSSKGKGESFECNPGRGGCGRTRIVMGPLENYIADQVFYVLDTPEVRQAIADQESGDDPTAELRKKIFDDEQKLKDLEDEYDDGNLPRQRYQRRRARLTDRIETNTQARDAALLARKRINLPTGTELQAIWADRDDVWKRTILASVIERIEVGPQPINPKTGRAFTSAPPRKRGEDEAAWKKRFELHRAKVFSQRLTVTWLV
ncbi:recombinase family protein [Micromonospora sp. CA-246542]|uniref:recombinase family protein n=1 Tax=Micromonospora sp. CA-246542 TaxID=3239959 RepID=UPI003D919C8F